MPKRPYSGNINVLWDDGGQPEEDLSEDENDYLEPMCSIEDYGDYVNFTQDVREVDDEDELYNLPVETVDNIS